MNKNEIINIIEKNNMWFNSYTYSELAKCLKLELKRGGYRQRQIEALKKIVLIRENKRPKKSITYTLIEPQHTNKHKSTKNYKQDYRFNIPYEKRNDGGLYIIKCDGYIDYIGNTNNYRARFNHMKKESNICGEMLNNGGIFSIYKE